MKHFKIALLASVVAMSAAMPAAATITIYTDRAAFVAALGGTAVVEDFEDTTLVSGLSFVSTSGTIGGGTFNDQLAVGSQTTTFSFTIPNINAFGADFDLSPNGPGIGVQLTPAPGATLTTQVANSFTGQFFGFISTDAFSSVLLTGGTQGVGLETYNLDNLTFGTSTGAVPEPASWAMMLGGFGLMGTALRMRRRTAISFG